MLLLRQILVIAIVLASSAVGLSACGQQGALYLPAEAASAPPRPPRPAAENAAESGMSVPAVSKPSALPASATP